MDLYCKYECHWKCGESEGGLQLTLTDGSPADEAQEIDALLSPKATIILFHYLGSILNIETRNL